MKEIADASDAGYCFRANDRSALVDVLGRAAAVDVAEYLKLGENARKYAEENFSWEKTTEGLSKVYAQVAKAP